MKTALTTISPDQRLDLLVTALEGGSNYWFDLTKLRPKRISRL